MTTYAKIMTNAVLLNPTSVADINAIYVDPSTNQMSNNSNTGTPSEFSTATPSNIKRKQCFAPIALGKPVSLYLNTGKVIQTDSDGSGTQKYIGIAVTAFESAGDFGNVLLIAPNAAGVLTDLGFSPGAEIFIGESTGGFVDDISGFSGDNDSIIKAGMADCADNESSTLAKDLILVSQVIARP